MPNTFKLAGHVFDNTGAAVAATVQRYEVATTTTFGSSTTASGSTGKYAFTDGENGYDIKITYGSNVRWLKGLDELNVSELAIIQSTEGGVANLYIAADQADDAGDSWRVQAGTSDTLAIANNKNATNTFVDQLTLTNHATATSTNLAVSGSIKVGSNIIQASDGGSTITMDTSDNVTIAGDLTISGDDLKMATNTDTYILVADGTSYNPVAVSGDIAITNAGVTSIAAGVIVTADIANDAITGAKIADNALDSDHYVDGSIDNAHLADDAVDSDELAAGAVDTAHIADNQVTVAKLVDVARGSIIYGNASAASAELTKGSANTVLKSDGTDIAWGSITVLGTVATGVWNGTAITVPYGGTGATALTDGGVLLGSNTGAITAMSVLADSEMIVGDGSGDPVAESGATLRTSIGVGTGDSPQFTGIELSHASDNTLTASSGDLSIQSVLLKKVGTEDMWVPAAAMQPTASNGCAALASAETTSGRPDMQVLDFDKDSDEFAQFSVCMPKSWNAGTVTFQAFWTTASTNTGTVAWGMSGTSVVDDATINVTFSSPTVATADAGLGTAENLHVGAVSGAITIKNAAASALTFFQILRDVSADSHTSDARLVGVKIIFTTNASTDA